MKNSDTPYFKAIVDHTEILKLFDKVLSKHIKIKLEFEKGRREISQLLLIDQQTSSLLFDRILPISHEPKFTNLKAQTSSFEFTGSHYEFDLHDLSPIEEEGDIYYSVSIPKTLRCIQRREHYRVELPPDLSAHIKPYNFDQHEEMGKIVDVSVGGIGAEFNGNKESLFNHRIALPESTVYIGNELGINTDLAVCFCQFKPKLNRTQVGFKLIRLHPMDEKKIARLIIKLQIMRRGNFNDPTRRIIRHIY